MSWRLVEADCVEAMAAMPDASVDAVVTDPPYGLEFMGKEWDRLVASPRGRTAGAEHAPTLEGRDDSPYHRMAVRQPSALMRCARCGGNSSGEWNRCVCERPDFRARTDLARAMQEWHERWAVEALRVLKPGGHLLAFGGTRTCHRLVCAVEDAGFEIRDTIMWLYGSGFPKSLDVSKAIDKAAGAEREVVGERPIAYPDSDTWGTPNASGKVGVEGIAGSARIRDVNPGGRVHVTAPATPEAARWQGWGTALKPAHEPIVVARKSLSGTVAATVLEHGTGALNVDGCRVEAEGGSPAEAPRDSARRSGKTSTKPGTYDRPLQDRTSPERYMEARAGEAFGRWPANVALDEAAAAMLDEQTGELSGGGFPAVRDPDADRVAYQGFNGQAGREVRKMEGGGASRFFYCAKASRAERNAGLLGLPRARSARKRWQQDVSGRWVRRALNRHPTVKPVALMRWLVRLVTPPGGMVLDPFAGSGSTGVAAVLEGFEFVGVERDAAYVRVAEARIGCAERDPAVFVPELRAMRAARRPVVLTAEQHGLFDDDDDGEAAA